MISNLITYYVNSANKSSGNDSDNFNYTFNIDNELYKDIDHVSVT